MIVQSLWIGDTLSQMEQICLRSFILNGHDFHLYTYSRIPNLPKGVTPRDANEILPLEFLQKFQYVRNSQFSVSAGSNVFRYKLLRQNGGIWVDTDVVCLRPFELHQEYVFPLTSGRLLIGRDDEFSVDSWFLKTPQQSDFMSYCYETAADCAGRKMDWGEIGPVLVTSAVKKFGFEKFCRGPMFFPINWARIDLFTTDTLVSRLTWQTFSRYSIAMHLYRVMWHLRGIDPNSTFPKHSIYELLKQRYLS
jgi:hypothetical protein